MQVLGQTFGGKTMPDLFEIMESCRAMRRLKPDPVAQFYDTIAEPEIGC